MVLSTKIHLNLLLFKCGTDFGTQTGTFCSKDVFRELYMPYYKKMNNWIHENTCWKTLTHSCGAVEPFIGMFIESDFDIMNPVQCSAKKMADLFSIPYTTFRQKPRLKILLQ